MESIKSYDNQGKHETSAHKDLLKKVHKLAKNINDEYEKMVLNKVIALCREMTHVIEDAIQQKSPLTMIIEMVRFLLCYFCPIIPHIIHEIEEQLGDLLALGASPSSVWVGYDPDLVKDDQVIYVIQVNGKLKGQVLVPTDANESFIKDECRDYIRDVIKDVKIQKEIFVKGRLVNFVVY
jgi:leucyl-tRNA synthetase